MFHAKKKKQKNQIDTHVQVDQEKCLYKRGTQFLCVRVFLHKYHPSILIIPSLYFFFCCYMFDVVSIPVSLYLTRNFSCYVCRKNENIKKKVKKIMRIVKKYRKQMLHEKNNNCNNNAQHHIV